MSDLISRQAVNKIIDKWLSNPDYELKDHIYEMTKKIHELPSVENKGGWNPLESDEEGIIIGSLPEEGEEVLVTVYGQVEIDSFGCDVEYDESVGESRYEWFCENNDIEDVTAWMPLPEPYKAEKPETCKGCLAPCIMYEPDMRACKKKVRTESEDT